jgi:hypothetical protein
MAGGRSFHGVSTPFLRENAWGIKVAIFFRCL